MEKPAYLPEVKRQYEEYPFPPRDPEEERGRLIAGAIDHAALVNHYCFAGKQSFVGCRVLVAGGGTGDGTIFWAEQLRDKGGEVVHVDISEASLRIARRRAEVRKLENIVWKHDSLLNLSAANVGTFHFINCYGVLHHLAEPEEGLRVLHGVLRDDGTAGVLLYAKHGRAALYQVQELLRRFGIHKLEIRERIAQARQLMALLPETSWYKLGPNRRNHETFADEVFFDSYLHSQDRAYTIPELYRFIESGGFHFVAFSVAAQRVMYRVETFIRDKGLLALLPDDERERQAIAELIGGQIGRHEFYISKRPVTAASCDDLNNVPFFFPQAPERLADQLIAAGSRTVMVQWSPGIHVRFRIRPHTVDILRNVDGRRSLGEIFQAVRNDTRTAATDEELLAEFRPIYDVFHDVDAILLRDKSIDPFPGGSELHARVFGATESTVE